MCHLNQCRYVLPAWLDVKSDSEALRECKAITNLVSSPAGTLAALNSLLRARTLFHPNAINPLSLLHLIPLNCLHARFQFVFTAARVLALPPSFLLQVSRPHFLPSPAQHVLCQHQLRHKTSATTTTTTYEAQTLSLTP